MKPNAGETSHVFTYDLFISYSNDPDYNLSRKIEAFLESFHKLRTPVEIKLNPLSVCRDGSDFSLHSIKKQSPDTPEGLDFVKSNLIGYLRQSRYLLLLCSKNSTISDYVQFEINWFLENNGVDSILLAVTEGDNIQAELASLFSPIILQNKIHTKPFYDFRGFKKTSKNWKKVRNHDEELTNLAAHLNNETSGRILPVWRREEQKKIKRQRYIGVMAAIVFLVLSVVAVFKWQEAVSNKNQALESLNKLGKEQFRRNMRNGVIFLEAEEFTFALKEFLAADSIISKYPTDNYLLSQKDTISHLIKRSRYAQ